MKILANKTNLYNNIDFLKETINKKDLLEGVGFNIAITKDNQFVVFSPVADNQTTIQTIASKNLTELENLNLLTLDYVLNFYSERKSKLKIFLNLLPATIPITSEESLEILKNINNVYKNELLKTISPYNNLDLYMGSVNSTLIKLIQDNKTYGKVGMVLYGGNLNYIDVDFYVFGTGFLNDEIFKQQLDLDKEVILYLGTGNDLSIAYEYFRSEKSTALAQSIFNDIYFLNDYPNLFIKLFTE